MAAAKKFSVYVHSDLIAALDVLKEIDRSKRATVINKAIEEYVNRRRRAIAAYRRKQPTHRPCEAA